MSEFSRRVTGAATVGVTLAALTGAGLAGEDVRPAYPATAPQATHECPEIADGSKLQFVGDLTPGEMTQISEGGAGRDATAAKIARVLASGDVQGAQLELDAGVMPDQIADYKKLDESSQAFAKWLETADGIMVNGPIADSTQPYRADDVAHLRLMGQACPEEITEPYN
ncbi:MAG TPA: hypothetical protein VHT70_05170 [Candidatus Saccharimonadales bacterium]|jgi:hypothetical protein|nr:hypothetical protein [Candidatus Saccharimonadales bacterium]